MKKSKVTPGLAVTVWYDDYKHTYLGLVQGMDRNYHEQVLVKCVEHNHVMNDQIQSIPLSRITVGGTFKHFLLTFIKVFL